MNEQRLDALSEFLAGLKLPSVDISTNRQLPEAGNLLFLRALLRHVHTLIGAGDAESIKQILKDKLTTIQNAEPAMEQVWKSYKTDEQLFATLSTMLSVHG